MICAIGELREHLAEIAEYRCKAAATEIITSAIDRTLCYSSEKTLYVLTTDSSGKVLSAQLDANAANRIKNKLTEEIEKELEALSDDGISVPIGTLLGIPLLAGNDTAVDLSVQQLGAVKSDFRSSLEEAGINQTRLTVYITVTVEIRAILPNGHKDVTVAEEHMISDSLIVGDTPDAYLSK